MKKRTDKSKVHHRKNRKKQAVSTLLSLQLLSGVLVMQQPMKAEASGVAPVVQVLNPVDNAQQVLGKVMVLTGNVTDESATFTIKYQIDGGTVVSGQTLNGSSATQSFKIDIQIPSNFSTGTHSLKVWAEDSDGNISPVKDIAFEVNTYAPPTLSGSQVSNYAKLEWATDILDEDVLVNTSLEEGHELPRLVYNSSNGAGAGGQSITTEEAFTGVRAYKVDTTTDKTGNTFNYPDTYSNSSHSYWAKKYISNGTPISVSFRAKTTGNANINFYGGWEYGLSFQTVNQKYSAITTDVYVTETAPAGQNWIKVSDVKGFTYGTHLTTDTDPNVRTWNSSVTTIDAENKILYLASKLNKPLESGHVLMARPSRTSWSFASKGITAQDGWTLFNVNTTVANHSDVNWLQEGANLRHSITSTGDTYIDDVKFGYASETFLYRDGQQIYRGYGSAYDDKTATDKAKPKAVQNVTASVSKQKATINWDNTIDEGSTYNYTAKAIGHSGTETPMSQTYPVTVSSGVKGYSVVVDKNPGTNPDATIETTSNQYSPSQSITGSFYVHVATVDNAGNISDVTHYYYEDSQAPSVQVTPSNTTLTNGDVVLTVNATDDKSGIYRIQLPDGTWVEKNNALFTVSKNGDYTFLVDDHAGNRTTKTVSVQNIDKTVPTITVTPSTTEWTKESVVLNMVATDSYSGVERVQLPNGSWVNGNNGTFTANKNGIYSFIAVDKAGNSKTFSYEVTNIDSAIPSGLRIDVAEGWLKQVPTISLVVDGEIASGIKQMEYKLEGDTVKDWTIYQNPFSISQNGITKISAKMTSNSGIISDIITKEVKVDTEKPVVNTTLSESNWTTAPVTISLDTTDNVSGVSRIKLPNGSYVYSDKATFTTSSNGTFAFEVEDVAGNITTKSVVVSNIDRVNPTATIESSVPTGWTKENILLTLKVQEAESDIKRVQLPSGVWVLGISLNEDKSVSYPISANGTYSFKVEDMAGNVTTKSISVTNIDKEAPSVSTSMNTTDWTNQSVTIFLNSYDLLSGVESVQLPNGTIVNSSNVSYGVNTNGDYKFIMKDKTGNVTEKIVSVKNIDKTAPGLNLSLNTQDPSNSVMIQVDAQDGLSGMQKVILPDGKEETRSVFTYPVNANGTFTFTAVDKVGNQITKEIVVKNVDKTPPMPATITASITTLTKEDVVLTAIFPQDAVVKQYKIGSGVWTSYPEQGVTVKYNSFATFRSFDQAGNESEHSSFEVTNIDKVAPTTPSTTTEANKNRFSLDGEENAQLYYRAVQESPLSTIRLLSVTEPSSELEWTLYEDSVTLEEDGNYKIEYKAVDEAGNESDSGVTNVQMYANSLTKAQESVLEAEKNPTETNVGVAEQNVQILPPTAPESNELEQRVTDLEELVDAQKAIEQALASRNEADVELAKEKIELLNGTNPVIIDILPELELSLNKSEILTLIAKERYDILSSEYDMSRESYNALVQIYYAIKYTGDTMYKMAGDKVALVPSTDKYYDFVNEQYGNLNTDYDQFVEERVQTDSEIKAESSVKVMEANYDPSYAVNTQSLINAVEDETVRGSLQQRLDTAKAKYQTSLLAKAEQDAVLAVEKAESSKNTYYISEAYKKVNYLTNVELKFELTTRLQVLEAKMALDRKISDATRTVELAEQYKYQSYITSAQTKVSALPDGEIKTSLQTRLDALKVGQPIGDQATIIQKAKNALSLAISLRTQYYVDKAQTAINLVTDATIKAELQAKLDAIIVK